MLHSSPWHHASCQQGALHGVRKPDVLVAAKELALALQTRAVNVAGHKAVTDKITQEQEADCANDKQRACKRN